MRAAYTDWTTIPLWEWISVIHSRVRSHQFNNLENKLQLNRNFTASAGSRMQFRLYLVNVLRHTIGSVCFYKWYVPDNKTWTPFDELKILLWLKRIILIAKEFNSLYNYVTVLREPWINYTWPLRESWVVFTSKPHNRRWSKPLSVITGPRQSRPKEGRFRGQ